MGQRSGHNHHHTGSTNQLGPLQHPTVRADKPPSLHPTAHPVPCCQSVGTTFVTAYRKPVFARAKHRPQPWPTVGCSSFRYLRPACTALPYYHFTTLPVNLTTSSQTLLLHIPCHGASSSALRQSLSFPSQPTPTLRYWRGLCRTGPLLPSFLPHCHHRTNVLPIQYLRSLSPSRNTQRVRPGTHPTVRADKPPSLHPTAHPVQCWQWCGTTSVARLSVTADAIATLLPWAVPDRVAPSSVTSPQPAPHSVTTESQSYQSTLLPRPNLLPSITRHSRHCAAGGFALVPPSQSRQPLPLLPRSLPPLTCYQLAYNLLPYSLQLATFHPNIIHIQPIAHHHTTVKPPFHGIHSTAVLLYYGRSSSFYGCLTG